MPAVSLAFASPPQNIGTGTCSAVIIVEARSVLGMPANVTTDVPVALSANPPGLNIYAGAGCAGSVVSFNTIPAGSSQVRFSVRTSTATTFSLLALGPPLSSATQNLTVFQLPTQLQLTANPAPPLRAGSCFQATVESRGPTNLPLAVPNDTLVTMSTDVTNGTLFFTDLMCTSPATTVTLRSGNTTATVYLKPVSGVPQVVSATAPFGTGTYSMSPVPIVRRNTCTVHGSSELCPIEPGSTGVPVGATAGRSFLITQSISAVGSSTPLDVEARCRLQGLNVNCARRNSGLTSDALTHFQVVELPIGLAVLSASSSNCAGGPIGLGGIVDPTRTFLLKSVVGSGSNFDQDDSVSVTLSGSATLTLSSNACEGYDVQAVQWEGVSVTRGQLAIPTSAFSTTSPILSPSSLSTMVLSQPSNDITFGGVPPCIVMGRAEVFSPTELRFFRGINRMTCNIGSLPRIVWERIDFGTRARVWPYTASLTQNTQLLAVPITPVDATRSFVITSSQQLGGQGSGEADMLGTGDSVDAAVQTRLVTGANPVNATTVEVARQASSSAALITFYVVQIDP